MPLVTLTPEMVDMPATKTVDLGISSFNGAIECITAVTPTLDGKFNPEEWPALPLTILGDGQIQLYSTRDATHLYVAYLISDTTYDANDAVNLFIDTLNNDLLDNADRRFVVARDGRTEVWAGAKSGWNSSYLSGNWQAETGEALDGWLVEMSIDVAAEMPMLRDSFGLMIQVQAPGRQMLAPNGADYNIPLSWQNVLDSGC